MVHSEIEVELLLAVFESIFMVHTDIEASFLVLRRRWLSVQHILQHILQEESISNPKLPFTDSTKHLYGESRQLFLEALHLGACHVRQVTS